jgi:preprotein translocase subunit SecG
VTALVLIVHIIICIILIIAVLLQSGKAADLAGAFGGGGSQTAFGPRGTATLLSKITTICAVLFMITSIALWILSLKGQKSVVGGVEPAKPAATAPTTDVKKEAQPPVSAPATAKKEEPQNQPQAQSKQPEAPKKEAPEKKPN